MTSARVHSKLQYPDPNRPFELFTGAPHYCYSGILHQAKIGDPERLIPIAYFSGCFNAAQQNYNVTMKEVYAAYQSVQEFQFYLGGALCNLHCNHKPLTPFFLGNMKTPTLNRWALELNEYNIVFKYIAGKKNIITDAIFRLKQKNLYTEAMDKNKPTAKGIEDSRSPPPQITLKPHTEGDRHTNVEITSKERSVLQRNGKEDNVQKQKNRVQTRSKWNTL